MNSRKHISKWTPLTLRPHNSLVRIVPTVWDLEVITHYSNKTREATIDTYNYAVVLAYLVEAATMYNQWYQKAVTE